MMKNKLLGTLLSLMLPGLGSAYARKVKKGILLYVACLLLLLSVRTVSYNFTLFVISMSALLVYYVYMLISGYRDVTADKVYEPARFDKWYVYILIIGLQATVATRAMGSLIYMPISFARIPTPAMDPTLKVGDILALKRTKSIERNDVTIFWFPDDIKTMYVKRCVGTPGDSLQIKHGEVLINGLPIAPVAVNHRYILTTDGSSINQRTLDKFGIGEGDYYPSSGSSYDFHLTEDQAKELRAMPFVKSVEISMFEKGQTEMVYPRAEYLDWNRDFYGPLYIPKKGDKLSLTKENIDLYRKCIAFENENVEGDNSGLMVNGQRITTYEFKENYYFMMGDSRHNSLDSRYWGLLPEKLVIGKALYIYFGKTWDRVGKKVR